MVAHMPVIPAVWRQRQKNFHKFESSLGYIMVNVSKKRGVRKGNQGARQTLDIAHLTTGTTDQRSNTSKV